MNSKTRALIALVLTLALPLRVYAAVAMEFCTTDSHAVERVAAPSLHASDHAARAVPGASAEDHRHAASRPDHNGGDEAAHAAQTPHSGTCLSCCCAALIAAAPPQFDLLPSPPPLAPPFTGIAIASFVPDGLDRPPQTLLA